MKNKPKVVFDTNIFINGIFFSENHLSCTKIIDLINLRSFQLLFAQDTIGELVYVTKNFARHNLDDKNDRIEMLKWLMELFYYSTSINTCDTDNRTLRDKYDEMFLKCATEGKADYLVSDDFNSGLHNIDDTNIKVVNSQEFYNLINIDSQ